MDIVEGILGFIVEFISTYYKTLAYILGCVIIISSSPGMDTGIGTGLALICWAFFKAFEEHY